MNVTAESRIGSHLCHRAERILRWLEEVRMIPPHGKTSRRVSKTKRMCDVEIRHVDRSADCSRALVVACFHEIQTLRALLLFVLLQLLIDQLRRYRPTHGIAN